MQLYFTLFIILALLFFFYNAIKRSDLKIPRCYIPFLDLIIIVRKGFMTLLQTRCRQFGDLYYLVILNIKLLVTSNPEYITSIFKESNARNDLGLLNVFDVNGERGLFMLNGDQWKHHRNLVSTVFSNANIKNTFWSLDSCMNNLVQKWNDKTDLSTVNIDEEMKRLTLEVIGATAFGTQLEGDNTDEILKNFEILLDEVKLRVDSKSNPKVMKKIVVEARKKIVDKILMIISKKIEEGVNAEKLDLLDALLIERQKEGQDLDDNAVVAESLSFLFAGSETTSSTLSIALYTLAMYPEIQEKLYREIRDVVGEGPVSYEHINKIQYLEWVVNEVMRLHPTAPLMSRVLENDIQLGEHIVAKDTVVLVDVKQLHNDPEYWENPSEFIPERFADYDKSSNTFIPFGSGKRVCVGKTLAMTEIQTVLMNLLLNFRFEKTEGLAWPIQTDFKFTTQPKTFQLNVVKRC